MLRLIIFAIIMLALSGLCNGQGRSPFGATRAQDTSFTVAHLKLPLYGTVNDSMVLVVLPNGNVIKISKSTLGGATPSLDAVTDVGNTTTNTITIGQSTIQTDSIGKLLLYQNSNVDSADIFGVVEGRADLQDVNTALARMEFIKLFDDSTRNSEIRFSVGDDATMPVIFSIGNDSIMAHRDMVVDGDFRADTVRSDSHFYGQGAYLGTTPTLGTLTSTLFRSGIDEVDGTTVWNGAVLSVSSGYTGAAALRLQNGLSISNVIPAENTSNWTQASSGHPGIRGVSSIISTEAGATGITDYGSNFYGTMSGVVGQSWNKFTIFNGGYASNANVNYATGLHLSDFKVGVTSRIGIHLDGNNETTGAAGSWGIYIDPTVSSAYNNAFGTGESYFGGYTDNGAYQLQVNGAEITTGLDNYSTNLGSTFTARTKVDKGYVDSSLALKGTVTTVSATDGNGFDFTVTNPTTTPAIGLNLQSGYALLNSNSAQTIAGNKDFTGTTTISTTTVDPLTVSGNVSSRGGIIVRNVNSGTGAAANFYFDASSNFTNYGGLFKGGTGRTGTSLGTADANWTVLLDDGTANAGIKIVSKTADPVLFGTTDVLRFSIKANGVLNIASVSTYADNAAALAGGLVAGDIYRTATGVMMIVF